MYLRWYFACGKGFVYGRFYALALLHLRVTSITFTHYVCCVYALAVLRYLLRLRIMYVAFTRDKRGIQRCYVYLSSNLYCIYYFSSKSYAPT